MKAVAVADAGPFIHLAEIDSLALLSVLDQLYLPETVYEELAAGGVPSGMQALSYERVTADRDFSTRSELHEGEKAALAIAEEYDAILLTDDMAARDVAKELSVEVHGSVGTIVFAYSENRIDRDEAVNRMRSLQNETSLFVTEAVIEHGIDMLDGTE